MHLFYINGECGSKTHTHRRMRKTVVAMREYGQNHLQPPAHGAL